MDRVYSEIFVVCVREAKSLINGIGSCFNCSDARCPPNKDQVRRERIAVPPPNENQPFRLLAACCAQN